MKIGIGRAHGKIILIGEHAVVYGTRAIAIPFFETKVETKVSENEEPYIKSRVYTGALKDAPMEIESITSLIKELTTNLKLPNLLFDINSSVPISAGMGSSAAVASSIVEAVFSFMDKKLPSKTRFEWTQFAERIAHGNPSGIDALTTSNDNALLFQKGHTPVAFNARMDGYLVVGQSGAPGNTKEAVSAVRRLVDEENKMPLITDIGREVETCYEAILQGNLELVGSTLNKAQKKLKELNVSTPMIDKMVELALLNGALGSKLTGGGRGGCVIALAKDEATAKNIKEVWEKQTKEKAWVLYLNEE